MKFRRAFRLLGIIITLSLLMTAIPAAPALASYDIEIDPEEGPVGIEVTITGEDFGWSESTERWVTVYFSEDEADAADQIDDEVEDYERVVAWEEVDQPDDGSFEVTFDVPAELTDGEDDVDVESGTYYICIVCTTDTETTTSTYIRSVAEFEVIGGEIEIDEDEGPVGTLVEITGTGFGAEDDIGKIPPAGAARPAYDEHRAPCGFSHTLHRASDNTPVAGRTQFFFSRMGAHDDEISIGFPCHSEYLRMW